MLKHLSGLLIALLLAGSAHSQGLGVGVGLDDVTIRGGGGAVTGDPTSVAILSNGWQMNVTWKGMACAGATSAYAFTTSNQAPNFVTLNVTSPGFTTAGAATTVNRTVFATLWLRQAEPNNLLPTEVSAGGNCTSTLVLSDFVNNTDTVSSVVFLSGVYTSGITSNAKTVAVTNNSIWAHAPPVCSRVVEDNQRVASGVDYIVEVACFHARPSGGKEVQAVIFTASDGAGHTATATSTTMTQSARITTGNPVYVYSATFPAGSFAAFNAGLISIDPVAYPIIGDHPLDFAAGADGVPIAYTAISPNLKPMRENYDPTGAYAAVNAWVQLTGTCSTTACIHTDATDPGTGAGANYPSVAKAAQQCQAYNNANRSHNDYAGCKVNVRAGTYNGFDEAAGIPLSGLTPGLSFMNVSGAPGTTNTTVVFKPAATGTGSTDVNNRIKFNNVGFAQADATSSAYNIVIVGQDGETSNPIKTEINCDGCLFTTQANFPMQIQIGLIDWYNSTLDQSANNGNLTGPFGDFTYTGVFYGNTLKGNSGAGAYVPLWLYTALGNYGDGMHVTVPFTGANFPAPTSLTNAFNRWMDSDWPLDINSAPSAPPTYQIPAGNFASVQNVYEKVNSDGGSPGPNVRFLGDEDQTPFQNLVVQYETLAGQRYNEMYNDFNAVCTPKYGSYRWTAIDPTQGSFNLKRDTFVSPDGGENPARICNWSVGHHVGSVGNVVNTAGDGSGVSSTGWLGEYYGLGGSTGVSVAFTTNNSLSGTNTGNGVYTLTGSTGSPAYAKVPSGGAALPFDLGGSARRNDGTGCAGAYEC